MSTTTTNPTLRAAIKFRHLSDAIRSDRVMIDQARERMAGKLKQAEELAALHGDAAFRAAFDAQLQLLRLPQQQVMDLLKNAADLLMDGASPEVNWPLMQEQLQLVSTHFRDMASLPLGAADSAEQGDWHTLWQVMAADLEAIRGICTAAYFKAHLLAELGAAKADELTATILKYIPHKYSIAEAERYERDYLEAMQAIKEEAGKQANLWDRVLNVIAGAIPFEQSPAERVMMQRWVNGEKGEL